MGNFATQCTVDQHQLEHVFEEKDLSVTFDSQLKFEVHTSTKVRKTNAIMGFTFLDCALYKRLFTNFVRSTLKQCGRLT